MSDDELWRLRSENAYMRGKLEILERAIESLRHQVDQADPNCPVGVALTRAAHVSMGHAELGIFGGPVEVDCGCFDVPSRHLDDDGHLPTCEARR